MTTLTEQEQYSAMTAYILEHSGREITAALLETELKVDRQTANYFLRDRNGDRAIGTHRLNGKVHRFAYGRYVYFDGPVPMDWRDKIEKYTSKVAGRKRVTKSAPSTPIYSTISKGGLYELIRYYPETNKVVLADEDGNLWTGSIVRVDV